MCVHLCTHVFALQHTSVCLCGHVFTHVHILQAQCLGKKGYYKILILLGLEIKEKLKEFTIKAFRHNLNKLIDSHSKRWIVPCYSSNHGKFWFKRGQFLEKVPGDGSFEFM